jgi:glycosyltransferase involved in cell wall biosynthesis
MHAAPAGPAAPDSVPGQLTTHDPARLSVELADAGPSPVHGSDRPRFSVVVPAYNEAKLLPACLDSLARQDVTDGIEVIVVDNASTDATAAIAHARGAIVVREDRAGVCFARQAGTSAARGEIVVSTDADTTFDDRWLSRIDAVFTTDATVVAVAGPCQFVNAPLWGRWYCALLFGAVHLISRLAGRVVYVTATNVAFRRSAWSGYDTNATQGGDELGLLRQLRTRGNVTFDRRNPTFTSARRMYRGLLYNLFVTCFFYYLFGYGLNRLTGRRIVPTAPHFRDTRPPLTFRQRLATPAVAAMSLTVLVTAGLLAHLVGA